MSEWGDKLLTEADNARLRSENDKLREERDHWHVEQVHAYGNWEDAHKRVIELEAENEKLRYELELDKFRGAGEIEAYRRETSVAVKMAAQAEAENDRLRELVRDMWPHVRHRSRMCGECELPCDTSDECLLYEPMRQRMVELGIEVGE